MESLFCTKEKITECAAGLSKIAGIFPDNFSPMRLILNETAGVLYNVSRDNKEYSASEYEEASLNFARYLKRNRVRAAQVEVRPNSHGKRCVSICCSPVKKGLITAKELSGMAACFFGNDFFILPESRQVIGSDGGMIYLEEMPDYTTRFGKALCGQSGSKLSGDSFSFVRPGCGELVMSLVDGMGCGISANQESSVAIELLEKFMEIGFSPESTIELVSGCLLENIGNGNPVTIDMCSVDEYTGVASLYKMGSATTFIKRRKSVDFVTLSSLPAGSVKNAFHASDTVQLSDGDYIIMLSDGCLDALPFADKERYMSKVIEETASHNPQTIADTILEEAQFYDSRICDDMTVMVCGIWKR